MTLSRSTAIIGIKTFHCQRIPVAQRTIGGRCMGVSHQRLKRGASEGVTGIIGRGVRQGMPGMAIMRHVGRWRKAAPTNAFGVPSLCGPNLGWREIVGRRFVFLLQSGRMAEKSGRMDE